MSGILRLGKGLAFTGWAGHAGIAPIVSVGGKISARRQFTGYQIDGGYAEYTVADARYCFCIPDRYNDMEAAPLLCAGLIGYRALKMTGNAARVGIYGFGAAAHIAAQILHYQGRKLFAFTRRDDLAAQEFAGKMGAAWTGSLRISAPSRTCSMP